MTGEWSGDAAIVRSAWVAGRAEPSQRSEMTTQWVCGEPLAVVGVRNDWLRVRGPDGYLCWVAAGGLLTATEGEAVWWDEHATAVSLGLRLGRVPGTEGPESPSFLPWGARLVPEDDDTIRLPGGATAEIDRWEAVVRAGERAERFPARPEAVVRTAVGWIGVPYLWGGRIREGVDCSGFVQAVFAMHGVSLPRDSGLQRAAGPALSDGVVGPETWSPGELRPGDLLFFGEGPETVTHVALVVASSRVVHAAMSNGSVAYDDLGVDTPLTRRLLGRRLGATRPLAATD